MNWFLTAVLCALLVELALRLPFGRALRPLRRSTTRALRVVRAKSVSDHWKEKAMAAYARTTFVSSVKLAGLLIALFAPAALLVVGFDRISAGFEGFILGWLGIGFSIVFACVYFYVRKSIIGHGRL